jgi:hypothetical protein
MAKINVTPQMDADLSGTEHVQQGTTVADTFAPQATKAIAEGALNIHKAGKISEAREMGKSLLEEFTQAEEQINLGEQQAAIFAEEEEILREHAKAPAGSEIRERTTAQLLGLEQQKKQLEVDREAVIQGLLSNDEYRKRAEMAFYQQVALTPGIKEELAAAMGEFLGFDPRGQTAKMTMAARAAKKEGESLAKKKMVDLMVGQGAWLNGFTDDQNIEMFWDKVSGSLRAAQSAKELTTKLNTEEKLTAAGNTLKIADFNKKFAEAEFSIINGMSTFGNKNIYTMDRAAWLATEDDVKEAWLKDNTSKYNQALAVINDADQATGGNDSFKAYKETLKNHHDLVQNILLSKQYDDVLKNNLSIAKQQNQIILEGHKHGIMVTQQDAAYLAAFNDLFNGSGLLANNIVAGQIILKGLQGIRSNLSGLDPKDLDATLKQYQAVMQSTMQRFSANPKQWDDTDIQDMGKVAQMIADQKTRDLDHATRAQLLSATGNADFMKRLEAANPEQAEDLRNSISQHQKAASDTYSNTIKDAAQRVNLDTKDFHIYKSEDVQGWALGVNTDAQPKLGSVGRTSVFGVNPQSDEERAARRSGKAQEAQAQLERSLNRMGSGQLLNNLINTYVNTEGVTPDIAMKTVAADLGISLEDVEPVKVTPGKTPVEEKPGFAEAVRGNFKGDLNPALTRQQKLDALREKYGDNVDVKELMAFIEADEKNAE